MKSITVLLPRIDPGPMLVDRLANIRAKLSDDTAEEVMAHVYAVRGSHFGISSSPCGPSAQHLRPRLSDSLACFADELDALLTTDRVPVRHRI